MIAIGRKSESAKCKLQIKFVSINYVLENDSANVKFKF